MENAASREAIDDDRHAKKMTGEGLVAPSSQKNDAREGAGGGWKR